MIIEQAKMDDVVLQLRIRQLLKYVGALLHDRPRREMPGDLRQVKDLVDKLAAEPLFPGLPEDGPDVRFHDYYLVEVLSDGELPPMGLGQLAYEIADGGSSGEVNCCGSMAVPIPVMAELLLSQSSDPAFLDCADDEPEEGL
jgi:hypothetical protein